MSKVVLETDQVQGYYTRPPQTEACPRASDSISVRCVTMSLRVASRCDCRGSWNIDVVDSRGFPLLIPHIRVWIGLLRSGVTWNSAVS